MKALVYEGPRTKVVENRPMPQIAEPTDAVVKIAKTTICGTDLHTFGSSRSPERSSPPPSTDPPATASKREQLGSC